MKWISLGNARLGLCRVSFAVLLALLALGTQIGQAQDDPLTLLWQQVEAQPQDFSVGCIPLSDESGAVFYNADARFPLASVSKLLIFIEYAQRLDAGLIPPDEVVKVSTLERYNLPRTDRGAHDRFMAQYPASTSVLPLWDVAVGMVQYSSNAASDYLLDRLAPIDWPALFQTLAITETDPPHSLTLIPLLMNNHETGKATLSDIPRLSVQQGEVYLDRYINDPEWRQAEIVYRSQRGSQFPDWETQAAILQQVTATGTVRDFLQVMKVVYGDDATLSLGVRLAIRAALRWTENQHINEQYVEYGSKLGFYSGGTLTLVAYGQPVGATPVISAAFFRNIPRRSYNDLLNDDAIGDLAHWMNSTQCAELKAALPITTDAP